MISLKERAVQLTEKYKCEPVLNLAPDYPIGEIEGYVLSKEQKEMYNSKEGTQEDRWLRQWIIYLQVIEALSSPNRF